jgi:hypothetical protein
VLVAEAFLGPRPVSDVRIDICHGDNDPYNNRLSNLRYDTHQANQEQMARDGRGNAGRTHCKRGHEFNAENTWNHKRPNGKTARVCRVCHYIRRAAA